MMSRVSLAFIILSTLLNLWLLTRRCADAAECVCGAPTPSDAELVDAEPAYVNRVVEAQRRLLFACNENKAALQVRRDALRVARGATDAPDARLQLEKAALISKIRKMAASP